MFRHTSSSPQNTKRRTFEEEPEKKSFTSVTVIMMSRAGGGLRRTAMMLQGSGDGKPGPKRGGVNCCGQRLGSQKRMKDVHVEKA